jgi:hypothetical protein
LQTNIPELPELALLCIHSRAMSTVVFSRARREQRITACSTSLIPHSASDCEASGGGLALYPKRLQRLSWVWTRFLKECSIRSEIQHARSLTT